MCHVHYIGAGKNYSQNKADRTTEAEEKEGEELMDADGHIIPIVEGDQGEGFKDPLDLDELLKTNEGKKLYKEALRRADQNQQAIITKMLNK